MERIGRIQLWRSIGGDVIEKGAELANTYDMPLSKPTEAGQSKGKKAVIRKVASAEEEFMASLLGETKEASSGVASTVTKFKDTPNWQGDVSVGIPHLVSVNARHKNSGVGVGVGLGARGPEALLSWAPGTREESPTQNPQMKAMKPHVDVSAKEPPVLLQEKKAQHYALPLAERYPLDSYEQVKTATRYFMETYKFMPPGDRHEYCLNLVNRANSLDIMTDPLIEKYGSAGYASDTDIDICMNARRESMKDENQVAVLDKLASVRGSTDPEVFAEALERIDRAAGLQEHYGGDIPDAYFTTFGKTAGKAVNPKEAIVLGNEYITTRRLVTFLKNNAGAMTSRFGAEMAGELAKNPQDIFDSLPRDQKLVIMRLANNDDSPVEQAVTDA